MRSPAADRRRPTPLDAAAALAVAAFAAVLVFLLRPGTGTAVTAVITLDGEAVASYQLDQLSEPVVLSIDEAPYPVTVRAERGRICIDHSDCPSQDCVRTGWISQPGQQIICLPNRLVISLSGSDPAPFDAMTG